jgi:hypothetical protein
VIDPEGVRAKALRLYPQVLRDSLEAVLSPPPPPARVPFPLDVPADRGRSTEPFSARRAGIERLHRGSLERTGLGYALEYREIHTRREGRQSVVSRIFFPTLEDYLACIGKEREHADFLAEARWVLARLPGLEGWIRAKPLSFIAHLGEWDELSRVCDYFLRHPRPGCYVRQLPVAVHTKFIEEHRGILQILLDLLLPPSLVNPGASDFEGRYFLRSPESLVRLRFLDTALAVEGLDDLAVPLSRFQALGLRCRTVFIVENLMTFLAFPGVEEAVCVWGSGFQAARLGCAPWLQGPRVLYWGDVDRAGFEILARLRRDLPRVESMLMDRDTWLRYERFVVPDGGARAAGSTRPAASVDGRPGPEGPGSDGPADPREALLSPLERETYATLRQDPARGRLEQERITHLDLLDYLRKRGFSVLEG